MEKMSHQYDLKFADEKHSLEVQDIVGKPPGWLLRWSTPIFLLLIILFAGVAWFIQYSDTIPASFTLTARSQPKVVITKMAGKLSLIKGVNGQWVLAGQILGQMESIADAEEVIRLSDDIAKMWEMIQIDDWNSLELQPDKYKRLGELQAAFNSFYSSYLQIDLTLRNNIFEKKRQILTSEIAQNDSLRKIILRQRDLYNKEYALAQEDFAMKYSLYEDKVIPEMEIRQERSKIIQRQMPLENSSSALVSNNTNHLAKQKELLDMDAKSAEIKYSFMQSLNLLSSEIELWRKQYLLVAPISGQIIVSDIAQENQEMEAGQEVFYVAAADTGYGGFLKMSQNNFGKIRKGQTVLIRLASFPYQEYGKLKGQISLVTELPNKDGEFIVYVDLPTPLITDRNIEVDFKNGLIAEAEVVTDKRPLLYKLWYSLTGNGQSKNPSESNKQKTKN